MTSDSFYPLFKGGERRNEAIGEGTKERETEGIVIEENNEINC